MGLNGTKWNGTEWKHYLKGVFKTLNLQRRSRHSFEMKHAICIPDNFTDNS
jgi:hypothetical protein